MAQFVGYSGPLWLFPEVDGSQVAILFLVRFFLRTWKQGAVELSDYNLWIFRDSWAKEKVGRRLLFHGGIQTLYSLNTIYFF